MNKKEVLDIAHRIIAQCEIIRKARLELEEKQPRFVIGAALDYIGMCVTELEDLCEKPTAKETDKTDEPKPTDPNNIGEEMKREQELKLREDNDLLRQANIRMTAERDLYDRLYHELLGRRPAEAFEDELQKIRQWMKNAEFESVRLQNTFWHLCHILGYWEGGFNPKALWWNIVKAVNPVKPDEPYEAQPKVCESFGSKETVELAKRAPYESWKNYEKSIRHLAKIAEEAEKEKDKP